MRVEGKYYRDCDDVVPEEEHSHAFLSSRDVKCPWTRSSQSYGCDLSSYLTPRIACETIDCMTEKAHHKTACCLLRDGEPLNIGGRK